jgi:hypothetical protein
MSTFNRLLAILVFLVLIALLIGALAAMFGYDYEFINGYLSQEIDYLSSLEGWQLVLGAAVAVVLILFFVFLIFLEIARPVEGTRLLLSSGESGTVTMSQLSLEQYAEMVGLQIAQVRDIECRVLQTEKGLRIRCSPVLLSGTSVQNKAPEIQEHVSQAVTEVTGLPVISVGIKARYEAPDKHPAEQVL